jgi:hypothetical protein
MYYECLWIGTAFEKQEHMKCADKLIYNPRKHRCDNVYEFETQFANGIQTGEELIEFMRFRNCIGTRNIIDDSYSILAEANQDNTSPPTDYYPQIFLNNENYELIDKNKPTSPSTTTEKETTLTTTTTTLTTSTAAVEETTTTSTTAPTTPDTTTSTKSTPLTFTQKETTEKVKPKIKPSSLSSSSVRINETDDKFDLNFLMEDEKIYFGKKNYLNKLGYAVNGSISSSNNSSGGLSKKNETRRYFHIFAKPERRIKLLKKVNDLLEKSIIKVKKPSGHGKLLEVEQEDVNLRNNSSAFVGNRNNGTYIIFGKDLVAESNETSNGTTFPTYYSATAASNFINVTSAPNASTSIVLAAAEPIKRSMKLKRHKSFLGRKLLSVDEDEFSPTTILDDEEIESTDIAYHDKDSAIHEFTNRLIGQHFNVKEKNLTDNVTSSKKPPSAGEGGGVVTSSNYLIDSIEQRLTKRGEAKIEKEIVYSDNNETSRVVLRKETNQTKTTELADVDKTTVAAASSRLVSGNSENIFENHGYFLKNVKQPLQTSSKPVKFVKTLPKLNYMNIDERKQYKFDKQNENLTTRKISNKTSEQLLLESDDHFLGEVSNRKKKLNKHRLIGTTPTMTTASSSTSTVDAKTTTNASASANRAATTLEPGSKSGYSSSTVNPAAGSSYLSASSPSTSTTTLSISKFLTSTLEWTSSMNSLESSTISTFIPSKSNSKPFMQTYKINQTKKLPNQFASLRLNYNSNTAAAAAAANTEANTKYTKIDELERGGKFQRLRLVPADTLIECKENDFGLECSCSITLSPPKCKQLINSFLSSCRILGCKNNGKCINMAYKYPIPYVCSCPSSFMGTYCEIPRNEAAGAAASDLPENDFGSGNFNQETSNWRQKIHDFNQVFSTTTSSGTRQAADTRTTMTTTTSTHVTTSENQYFSFSHFNTFRPRKPHYIDTEFKEPLCDPNPCMNEAKCIVLKDSFECICMNSSFSGRYCENFRIQYFRSTQAPTSTSTFSSTTTTTTTTTKSSSTSTTIRSTTTSTTREPLSTTSSTTTDSTVDSTSRLTSRMFFASTSADMEANSTPASRRMTSYGYFTRAATNNHFEPRQSTNKPYFWQCPSNCFYHLSRGFCALSASGYPHCVCHIGWAGIDCSQKNNCIDNECQNNSTCVNYSELK